MVFVYMFIIFMYMVTVKNFNILLLLHKAAISYRKIINRIKIKKLKIEIGFLNYRIFQEKRSFAKVKNEIARLKALQDNNK